MERLGVGSPPVDAGVGQRHHRLRAFGPLVFIEYSEYHNLMKNVSRAFDDFSERMSDRDSCVVMRDYIAHFANPIRLKLLCLLVRNERLCVTELVEQTGSKQSTISQQLKQLQMARLVGRDRQGNRVLYSSADPVVEETMRFFASIADRVDPFLE